MPTQISLPVGFWSLPDPRASGRSTTNCFSELTPAATSQEGSAADAKQKSPPAYLRRAPGTVALANDSTSNPVRGMWEMAGTLYAVIGPTLYTVASTGALTQVGTGIVGSGFVRMTDNTACLVILIPSSVVCYTYTAANGLQQLTNAGFTQYGAIDCWFVDSYIVFLALNGLEFFNDDGQAVSGQGQITFNSAAVFPRELGTDPFVGMAVDHREVLLFGRRTSEGYLNAGNPTGSPFDSAPGTFMQIGMHPRGGYTAVLQDQAVFWLANDLTIRRRNGQTPVRVSNHAVEYLLEEADLTGCYAFAYTIGGHLMYALTAPAAAFTIVLDVATGEWHKMTTHLSGGASLGYWRPLCAYNAFGNQLIGDSQSGQIGQLDMATYTEFGLPMTAEFSTQSVYDAHNRISHRRLEIVATPGGSTSYTTTPQITPYVSDDSGKTWRALPMRSLGTRGQYQARAVWYGLGMSRDRAYRFKVSDPSQLFTVDIQAELQGGRY